MKTGPLVDLSQQLIQLLWENNLKSFFWKSLNRDFPGCSEVKASACNAGDLGLTPGSGRPLGEGNGNPFQYSCLENPMDGGAWWATVHRVAKSQTRLSDLTFTSHFHALEKEMATHSSVLAWRIPGSGGAWWAVVCGVAQSRTRLKRLSSSIAPGFPGGSDGEKSACSAGDPGSGRPLGEGNGNPLQYSCLENPRDREAWQAIVHRVAKSGHD